MSGIRSVTRRPTVAGFATAGSAPFYVDSDDNRVKIIPAGSGTTEVVLQEAGGASVYERLTAARVLTAADSGKTFALALAGGFTVTLPALSTVSGFRVSFIVEIAPTTAYIISAATADLDTMAGLVFGADGASSGANSVTTFSADQYNFVANVALIGDKLDMEQVGIAGWSGHALIAIGATGGTFTG
jgi:hypothetical protein